MDLKSEFPLKGKTIIITRSQDQQSQTRELFQKTGARVLDLPALTIGPPEEWGPLDDALSDLESFHWVIFSSINGVQSVENRLGLIDKSLKNDFNSLKIAAVGQKTALFLERLGAKVDFVPPKFVAESLIQNFPNSGYGLKILIPRVQSGGRSILLEEFRKSGAKVFEVAAYETSCPVEIPQITINALLNAEVDIIAFTSAKTAKHTSQLMRKYFGDDCNHICKNIKIISIGPQTSISCRKYFNRVDKEANPHDISGLLQACINSFNSNI